MATIPTMTLTTLLTDHLQTAYMGITHIPRMHVCHTDTGARIISMVASLSASVPGSGGDLGRASVADSTISMTSVALAASGARASEISEAEAAYEISAAVTGSAAERPVVGSEVECPEAGSAAERPVVGSEVECPEAGSAAERPVVSSAVECPDVGSEVEHPEAGPEAERPVTGSEAERLVAASAAERPAVAASEVEQVAEEAADLTVVVAAAADIARNFPHSK